MPAGKRKYFFIIVVLILLGRALAAEAAVVDKIVVVVNDEIITQGEIDRMLFPIYHQYKTRYSGQELNRKVDQARISLLDRLISDKLLLAEAKKLGIEATQGEIDTKISEVRRRFTTENEFKEALAQENIVLTEFEKSFKDRIMIDKLIDVEIRRGVSISPNEIVTYYDSHRDEFVSPRKASVSSIIIRMDKGRSREEALKLAEEILGRLEIGGNFSLVAKEYSDGPYAEYGGSMGWVTEGELMEPLNSTVFNLEQGEVSGILETKLGFHMFTIDEKVAPKALDFSQVKSVVENVLYNQKVQDKLTQWLDRLKENAYIAFK
ncbi:peptidylprolyl isomerase [Candidatus Omnitrophota bacterium]